MVFGVAPRALTGKPLLRTWNVVIDVRRGVATCNALAGCDSVSSKLAVTTSIAASGRPLVDQ
jgi:hypothetical protein